MAFNSEEWKSRYKSVKALDPKFFEYRWVQNMCLWAEFACESQLDVPFKFDSLTLRQGIQKAISMIPHDHKSTAGANLIAWLSKEAVRHARLVRGETVILLPWSEIDCGDSLKFVKGQDTDAFKSGEDGYAAWNVEPTNVVTADDMNLITNKLANLTQPDDVLYINAGHCNKGLGFVTNWAQTKKMPAWDLVKNFIKNRLPKSFSGSIKLWSCWIGMGNGDYMPFAQLFADCMAVAGYTSCRIYGYEAALLGAKSHEPKTNGLKESHRWTTKLEVDGKNEWISVLASTQRKQFHAKLVDWNVRREIKVDLKTDEALTLDELKGKLGV